MDEFLNRPSVRASCGSDCSFWKFIMTTRDAKVSQIDRGTNNLKETQSCSKETLCLLVWSYIKWMEACCGRLSMGTVPFRHILQDIRTYIISSIPSPVLLFVTEQLFTVFATALFHNSLITTLRQVLLCNIPHRTLPN